jgi:membrane protease subunit (stomatin/prohibitin family)
MNNFDPSVMKMGMMNPLQMQQFQQMMYMQQFQRQQMQRQSAMAAAAAAAAANNNNSNIPPETQKPPTGYQCFKCGQPGHWIYYCPNVPKGQFVQRSHIR